MIRQKLHDFSDVCGYAVDSSTFWITNLPGQVNGQGKSMRRIYLIISVIIIGFAGVLLLNWVMQTPTVQAQANPNARSPAIPLSAGDCWGAPVPAVSSKPAGFTWAIAGSALTGHSELSH